MKRTTNRSTRTFLAALGLGMAALALAGDSAADPVYNSGWTTGQNGGTGWQPWFLYPSGIFGTGDSNSNGNGSGPGINTAGRAWALGTSGVGVAVARRNMNAPLSISDWLYVDLDPLFAAETFFELRLYAGTTMVFMLTTVYNQGGFGFRDATGFHQLTNTSSSGGYRFGFMPTGNGTYGATLQELGTINTAVWSGTIGSSTIDTVVARGGIDEMYQAQRHYINSMSIVPEPSTLLALGAGIAALVARRRRRSR